jgi:hypothetical protein
MAVDNCHVTYYYLRYERRRERSSPHLNGIQSFKNFKGQLLASETSNCPKLNPSPLKAWTATEDEGTPKPQF